VSTTSRTSPAPPHTGVAIEVTDLVKTYGRGPKAVPALDGVSFAVPAGAVVALLGPNGAGKSTTVKILTTLTAADAGRATVAGMDVTRAPADVRRAIGYVPQRPSFDPTATGQENLTLQGRIHGLPGRVVKRRTAELLERFGLADAADRVAKTWSGGMQRKLDVALGLIHRPQVLFLDEPTTGLDPEARAEMWAEIGRLSGSEGLTVLLTTHYLEEADNLAEQVVIIDRGTVVASGSPDELKAGLGRDTIQVELDDAKQAGPARAALERAAGGAPVSVDGATLRVGVANGAATLSGMLAALAGSGAELASVTLSRPSLDDVYLRHAGRSFRAADEAGSKEVA
jgi:ABC-2 type transport system ATP-binding protein